MYIASLLVFLSCILLSLSIKRHYADIKNQSQFPNVYSAILFRLCGFGCLIFGFVLLFNTHGLTLGLVYLAAIFTTSAFVQTLLLSYLTNWINRIPLALALIIAVLTLHEQSTQFQTLVAHIDIIP